MKNLFVIPLVVAVLIGCEHTKGWQLQLAHTESGEVTAGSQADLVNAIRAGCQIRVAWGARRKSDPDMTIEHSANPVWVTIRNGTDVQVQLEEFAINLGVLGEPAEDHPRRERFGGTEQIVHWQANLKTDGSFDAVWFYPHSGEFIFRAPQTHPMRWYADCAAPLVMPLYPEIIQVNENE